MGVGEMNANCEEKLAGFIEKINSGQDITPEEADKIYLKIQNFDSEADEWLHAVLNAVSAGRDGNFVTAVPIVPADREQEGTIDEIRKHVNPPDRISKAFVINAKIKENSRPGLDIKKEKEYTAIDCNRFKMARQLLKRVFPSKVYIEKNVDMEDYIKEHFFKQDRYDERLFKDAWYIDVFYEKVEFLRRLGFPIAIVRDDYRSDITCVPVFAFVGFKEVFIQDCDLVRRTMGMTYEELSEMIEARGEDINLVKISDVAEILLYSADIYDGR